MVEQWESKTQRFSKEANAFSLARNLNPPAFRALAPKSGARTLSTFGVLQTSSTHDTLQRGARSRELKNA